MADKKEELFLNPQKERLVQADGQNMYTPKASFWDQFTAGFGVGQDYTSYSLLADVGLKMSTSNALDTIEKDEWNETHPYYFEDVEWTEDLTLDVARNIFAEKTDSINYEKLVERGGGGGMLTRGLGIFSGAALDPINVVAAPAAIYTKAGLLGKMAMAGAANFVVESALQGVAYGTQDVRGEDLGVDDVALNLGMAFGIGAAFPLAGRGISALYKSTRGSRLPTDGKTDKPDYTKTQKDKINIHSGHTQTTRYSSIANTNFNTIDSVKIDTKGRINTEDGRVVVTKNNDATISITGSAVDLSKILPTIATRLDSFENINIKVDDAPVQVVTNAEEITAIAKQIEQTTGVKAELDAPDVTMVKVEVENKNYEIELDDNGDLTGRVFKARKDGKRGKQLKQEEAESIIDANKQQALHTRTKINENTGTAGQETNRTNRAGNETVDSKLNNKKNYSTQNEVDASVSGQSRDFRENYGNTQSATKAWTAESVISTKNLFRAGYMIDAEKNELIDLTQIKVERLDSKLKDKLARSLQVARSKIPTDKDGYAIIDGRGRELRNMIEDFDLDMKANNDHKESLTQYALCMLAGGSI